MLVVCGIEPVTEVERATAVRFIQRIIVKMINWDREVVFWVEEAGIGVLSFEQPIGNCISLSFHISSHNFRKFMELVKYAR
jgi:hypothetical protein